MNTISPALRGGARGKASAARGCTASEEGLPLLRALMLGSPWSDMSKTGDSYNANAGVDNMITNGDF
jgi:epsilon-lactone hydrolase